MSTYQKDASDRPSLWVQPGAFSGEYREDILDCITAYYNDTSIDISDARHGSDCNRHRS